MIYLNLNVNQQINWKNNLKKAGLYGGSFYSNRSVLQVCPEAWTNTSPLSVKNCSKVIRKTWYELMNAAALSCEMDHAFDGGEWSCAWDGEKYQAAFEKFKAFLNKYDISYKGVIERANICRSRDPIDSGGWGDIAQSIAMFEQEYEHESK